MSSTNQPKTELTTLDRWNEDCLVRVKAQVMTRDDSTGMWVPLSGGGMSFVSLHRFSSNTSRTNDDVADDVAYVILGQRIADKSTALNCELLSDLEYTSVNPTFHHWTTNRKRFGLTFQTSSDATAFQRSIHAIPPLLNDDNDDHMRLMQQQQQGTVVSKAQLHITAEEVLNVLQQQVEVCSRHESRVVSTQDTIVELSDDTIRSSSLSPPPSSSIFHHRPSSTKESSSSSSHSTNDRIQQQQQEDHHRTMSQGRSPPPKCITPRIQIKHPHSTASPMTDQSEIVVVPPRTPPRFPLANTSSPPPPDPSSTGVTTLGDYGYYVDVSPNTTGLDRTADIWLEGKTKDLGRKVGLLAIPSDEADDLIYFSGSYVHFARNADPETHDYCYPSLDAFATSPYGTRPPTGPPRSTGDPRAAHLSTSVPVPLPIKTRRKWLKHKKSLPAKSSASKSSTSKSSTPKSSTSKSNMSKSNTSKSSMSKSNTSKSSTTRHRAQGAKVRCVYCDEFFSWDENRPGSCRDAPDRVLACIKAATCVCCQEAVAYHCGGNEDDDSEDCDRLDCGGGSRRGSGRRRAVLVLICLVVPCLWCYLPLRTCHRLCVTCGCCGPRHKAA